MLRQKIDYGVDLGTTNSSIARMDNGKIRVIKSDDKQMDTTPSCVYFSKKQAVSVGLKAFGQMSNETMEVFRRQTYENEKFDLNTFKEFKRAMGTKATYFSPNMGREFTPEELSAEVLKKLRSYVTDDEVLAAVITIPMRFEQFQVDATRRATELAGFQYVETLQEPIAASIAYGLESKNVQGYWLVFDLGGGTFDAALLRVVDGIMKVVDTVGDTLLGGRDIDYAIVDGILIPHLTENYKIEEILKNDKARNSLRNALKLLAEEAKITLSKYPDARITIDEPIGVDDDGEDMEIDIKVSMQEYLKIVEPIYRRAIDLSKALIAKNGLKGTDINPVILVGGPTYSQSLRTMLKEQLSPNIDISVDPMTVVAQGAALFASTRDLPISFQKRDKTKIQLTLKYPETTVEIEENLGIRIDRGQTTGIIPEKIFIEVTRNDKAWSSGRLEITGDAEILPLVLNQGEANGFSIRLFDEKGNVYPCEPSSIIIIQGLKAAKQVIAYDFCIEAAMTEKGKQRMLPLKGLEKNQVLPAKGKSPALRTQIDIRPGNGEDMIRIPVYSGDPHTKAIYNNWAGTIVITGADFDRFLPKDSEVEITLYVDSTQYIKLSAYFPYIDETVEKPLESYKQEKFESGEIERELSNAKDKLNAAKETNGIEYAKADKLLKEINELSTIFECGKGDNDTERKVEERLRDVWKELDRLEEAEEIPKAKEELGRAINSLLVNNERYGTNQTSKIVDEMQAAVKLAMSGNNDLRILQQLTEEIERFEYWGILYEDFGFLVGGIKYYDDRFSEIKWQNSAEAKKLIEEAKRIISENPSKKDLQNVFVQISNLLPEGAKPYEERIDIDILAYR